MLYFSFIVLQYENAFAANRLQNYQVPNDFKEVRNLIFEHIATVHKTDIIGKYIF